MVSLRVRRLASTSTGNVAPGMAKRTTGSASTSTHTVLLADLTEPLDHRGSGHERVDVADGGAELRDERRLVVR
jgi:hypothetical protein